MKKLGRRSERLTLDGLGAMVQDSFQFGGLTYGVQGSPATEPDGTFPAYVQGVARRNGVVAAAVFARQLLMSQLRFTWRSEIPSDLGRTFGTAALGVLEHPGTMPRSRLLTAAEGHVSYAGNAYFWRNGDQLHLLRPDWVSVIIHCEEGDDPTDAADAYVAGYLYRPGGKRNREPRILAPSEVVQWAPEPDPLAWWRGQSWVTSVLREIVADGQATDHVQKFFANSATPQIVYKFPPTLKQDAVERFKALNEEKHAGVQNAYKSLYVGGGADVTVVGSQLQHLDLSGLQGGSETRVAARSRVPATVLGIREGLQGSALNAGNYSSARRMWADGWYHPTTDGLAETLEPLVYPVPGGSRLAADTTRVLFLQEDRKDEADIMAANVTAVAGLVTAGFDPETAVLAVTTGDLSKLAHSGLYSVQLQQPGTPSPQTEGGAA